MIVVFVALAIAPVAALVFWLAMRDWYLEWGATDQEVLAQMAGDEQV